MAEFSKISWTDHTFNAWIGCHKVSPGCKFCYAEQFANKYNWAKWGVNTNRHLTAPSTWAKPLAWQRKAEKEGITYRVFCSSLSDVFEDKAELIPWRINLFELITKTPNLNWLLLTKRPQNWVKFMPAHWQKNFPKNIWLGMSVCTQKEYNDFFYLQQNFKYTWGVKTTFISFEPLLTNIILHHGAPDWSIIGGESGFLKNARPMELSWVNSLIAQIKAQPGNNAIFFKQLGTQLAKKLKFTDGKGEQGLENLPEHLNWLKIRQFPDEVTEIINTQKNNPQIQLTL